jgi:hypothetical protein
MREREHAALSNNPAAHWLFPINSNAHLKRYDRDLSRIFRYSSVTSLYTLFETIARRFIDDFHKTYPGKCQ